MHHRPIAIFAVICLAVGAGGCASHSNKDYEEVLMPLQTGSVFHRRSQVRVDSEKKLKKQKEDKKKEEKKKAPKPEPEPSSTPTPEEESTPPPADRFR